MFKKESKNNDSDAIIQEYYRKIGQPCKTGKIRHCLNLTPTMLFNNMASTHHNEWITVDYIFYTKYTRRNEDGMPSNYSILKLLSNYELPSKSLCHQIGHIPNQSFGSDHFSMVSEFALLKP